MTGLTFNGNDLQTANIITSSIDHHNPSEKDIRFYPLAFANKSVGTQSNYPRKKITLKGTIKGSSIADLDSRLDTFKSYFDAENANLDIDYNGSTRRYICTETAMGIDRPGGLAFANFTIELTCVQPFGMATSTTVANTGTAVTASTSDYTHTYIGTAKYQLPIITIEYNSVTDGDTYLLVKNDSNNQGITVINQTIVATDIVIIDTYNRVVKLNGTEIDFIGSFPELPPGSQTLVYEDGFTARNYDITIEYTPLYR